RVDIAETAANDDASAGFEVVMSDSDDMYQVGGLSPFGQIGVIAHRNLTQFFRDKFGFQAAVFQYLFISIIVGLIYLQLDMTQIGIQNFSGAIFYLVVNQTFGAASPVFISVPMELPIVIREYQAGLYSVLAWYISKNISEIPMQIFTPIIFFLPVYLLVGFSHGFTTFFYMLLIMILVNSCAVGLGYMVSCLCRRVDIAPIIGVVIILPFLLFGGLLINSDDCPVYFLWIEYMSPLKYGSEALMKLYWSQIDTIPCNELVENCIARTGQQVLQNYSMVKRTAFSDAMILLAINAGFRVVGFFGLWLNVRKTK
ncbi:hypothetical protein Gpo141_00014402, partial [Globisporangium polare]